MIRISVVDFLNARPLVWGLLHEPPPGVTVTRPHQIIAPHVLGDVVFDAVRVPLDHRIGESGKGFALMLATLATFRVSVAGAAVQPVRPS